MRIFHGILTLIFSEATMIDFKVDGLIKYIFDDSTIAIVL